MKTRIIGIAGASAAGKSTLAKKLSTHYGCSVISADNYYKDLSHIPPAERNYDHPDSIDFDLMVAHLQMLQQGQSVDMPVYNFTSHSREKDKTIHIEPASHIIVEGILVLAHENLRKQFALKLFVKTDEGTCLLRRINRDIAERGRTLDSVIQQYEKTVRPMYEKFIEPSIVSADLIIQNDNSSCDFDISEVVTNMDKRLNGEKNTAIKFSLFPAVRQSTCDSERRLSL